MAYDPCVCDHETVLQIELAATDITQLNFNIEGTGNSTAIYDDPEEMQGNALSLLNGAFETTSSAYKRFSDIAKYQEDVNKKASNSVGELIGSIVPNWFGGFGSTLKLLDFFIGTKGAMTTPKLTGFDHTFSFEGDGNLLEEGRQSFTLITPGSKQRAIEDPQGNRPIYDNPLGVFALLEKPDVEFWYAKTEVFEISDYPVELDFYRWRLASELKYHVNTAGGLDPIPVNLNAAIVWKDGCRIFDSGGFDEYDDNFRAVPYNTACARIYSATTYEIGTGFNVGFYEPFNGLPYDCKQPQVQVTATLRSANPNEPQEILFSALYDVNSSTEISDPGNLPRDFNEEEYIDENIVEACSYFIFELPVTTLELEDFCDNIYDPFVSNGLTSGQLDLTKQSDINRLPTQQGLTSVYPNPFVEQLNIRTSENSRGGDYVLINSLGQIVQSGTFDKNTDVHTLRFTDGSALPSGIYFLQILQGESVVEIHQISKK